MALILTTIASVTLFVGIGATNQIRPFGPLIESKGAQPSILQLLFTINEIMDVREFRYVLVKPEEFKDDMQMLLNRAKFLNDAPYLWESIPFPDRPSINQLIILNRECAAFLESEFTVYPNSPSLRRAIARNQLLYEIWDAARDAKCEYYYIHIRRQALLKLKDELDKINPTWFFQGKIPTHVPEWYFIYIR